jgi:hypothetical protein
VDDFTAWDITKLKVGIRLAGSWPVGLTRTEEQAYREKQQPRIAAMTARLHQLEEKPMTTPDPYRANRLTHSWVTLDGENYSCNFCDTKTGSEPCPEGRMLDAQIDEYLAAEAEERRG